MLRQQQTALLRLGSAQAAALAPNSGLVCGLWRGQSSQAAPVDTPVAPVLPPFDYVPPSYTGPSKEEVLSLRKQFLSPGAQCGRCQRPSRKVDGPAGCLVAPRVTAAAPPALRGDSSWGRHEQLTL